VCRYQKGKTNLDLTEARDSEWQWHQLGHMQVCTSHQTDNHVSTPPFSFLQAGCRSLRPTNSVKALKANIIYLFISFIYTCIVISSAVCQNKDSQPVNLVSSIESLRGKSFTCHTCCNPVATDEETTRKAILRFRNLLASMPKKRTTARIKLHSLFCCLCLQCTLLVRRQEGHPACKKLEW